MSALDDAVAAAAAAAASAAASNQAAAAAAELADEYRDQAAAIAVGDIESVVDPAVAAAVTAQDIPGQIATKVSQFPTVVAAAAAAADAALDDAGVFHGAFEVSQYSGEDDPMVTFVDTESRRSWLEVAADGGPTQNTVDLMRPALFDGLVVPTTADATLGTAFAIVDENNRIAMTINDMGTVEFGDLGQYTLDKIIDAVAAQLGTGPAEQYKDFKDTVWQTASGPDIVCYGDSMTAGAGGNTAAGTGVMAGWTGSFPSRVGELLAATGKPGTVRNAGVGGENSVTITARTNATPLLMLPPGGSIPATATAVEVTLQQINGVGVAPLLQGNGGGVTGKLYVGDGNSAVEAIEGTISLTSGTYYFTRSVAGSVVTCDRPAAFRYDFGEARRGDIHVIWIGQNGPSHARAKSDVKAIIDEMKALNKRYIVISRPTSSDSEDAEWHDLYGRRFISIRKYLTTYGLADAGITPTSQDTIDMSNGSVPQSLRIDGVHFNAAGYYILGNLVYNRLVELGDI